MKIIKKNSGFTLIELMTVVGIMGVITLIIVGAQKNIVQSSADLKRNNELYALMQLVSSELSRDETCKANFGGNPIAKTYTEIKSKGGKSILAITPATDNDSLVKVLDISTSAGTGNKMNLTIKYQLVKQKKYEADVADLRFTSANFVVPINVFLKGGVIDTCYSDLESLLKLATKAACQGTGANWTDSTVDPPYGHCQHEVTMTPTTNITVGTGAFDCPAGQVISNIDTSTGKMTFQCSTVSINDGGCSAWNYLRGITSTGSSNCNDIRNEYSGMTGYMVQNGGTYSVKNFYCNSDEVLKGIDSAGNKVCVNPRNAFTCGVNQYATTDASGNLICAYATNSSSCVAGKYITQIYTSGDVYCEYPKFPNSCGAGYVMNGFDASGNVTCVVMPN